VMGFAVHVFDGPAIARSIGWPPGNPFQYEVGIASLGISVLCLLCIWRRGDFWLATIIMISVFGWGVAIGHINQIIQFQNYAPGNAGAILYYDLLNPVLLIGLYTASSIALRKERKDKPQEMRKAA
ncbi:hypothetical protein LCGC14_3124000, partial [marine sediment metagenome]